MGSQAKVEQNNSEGCVAKGELGPLLWWPANQGGHFFRITPRIRL